MAKKTLSLREQVLAPLAGFRIKTVTVPEWNNLQVKIREPSAPAWAKLHSIIYPEIPEGEAETKLTETQKAYRNIQADVVMFIDVLLDEDDQPVFSEADTKLVQGIYGPVHARLLAQAIKLGETQEEAEKK